MDGRASEAALHDFALVSTYLPIVGLASCSSLLICTIFWCLYTIRLPFPAVLMVASSLVYVDDARRPAPRHPALRPRLRPCPVGHVCVKKGWSLIKSSNYVYIVKALVKQAGEESRPRMRGGRRAAEGPGGAEVATAASINSTRRSEKVGVLVEA